MNIRLQKPADAGFPVARHVRAPTAAPPLRSATRVFGTTIGLGRIAWGLITAVVPARVHRALGINYPGPDHGIWVRAFGVRDVVLGVAAFHPDPTVGRLVLRLGIAVDLVDAAVPPAGARHFCVEPDTGDRRRIE